MTPRFSVSDFLAVVNQSLEVAFSAVEIEEFQGKSKQMGIFRPEG